MTYSINQFKAVLNGLGYNLGPNGIGGNQSNSLDFYTQAAIQEFQENHKLPTTGAIDQPTVEKARQLVRNLKHSLNVVIEAELPINEYYGPRTHQAIMQFQKLRHLPMTGIAGTVVRKELEFKVKESLRQQVSMTRSLNVNEPSSFKLA